MLSLQPPVSYSEQNPDFLSLSQPATGQPFKTDLEVKSDSQVAQRCLLQNFASFLILKLSFPFKISPSIFFFCNIEIIGSFAENVTWLTLTKYFQETQRFLACSTVSDVGYSNPLPVGFS